MAKQQQEEENQINVELSEEMAEGEYVNLAMIAHSQSEFVIDFIKMMPGIPKARVKSVIGYVDRQLFDAPLWLYPKEISQLIDVKPMEEISDQQTQILNMFFLTFTWFFKH